MYSFGGLILIMEFLIFCFIASFLIRSLVRSGDRQKDTTIPVQSEMIRTTTVHSKSSIGGSNAGSSGSDSGSSCSFD